MKRIKQLSTLLILMFLMGISINLRAQQPIFECVIKNDVQISPNALTFDIYIKADPASPTFELATFQAGIKVNGNIKNGGTISDSIMIGASDLLAAQVPNNASPASLNYDGTNNVIRIAPRSAPGHTNGTIISSSTWMKVCTIKIKTSAASFTPGEKLFPATNIWNFPTSPYPTKVYAYYDDGGGTIKNLQVTGLNNHQAYHTTNITNPYLNAWNGLAADAYWSTNANWSPSIVPANSADAYIPAVTNLPHVTANPGQPAQCVNLTIISGATVTIEPGKALTVTGNTVLNGAQCLIIQSSATAVGSFKDNGFSGSGTARVERWVSTNGTATGSNRWEYVSSPITAASSDLFTSAHPRGLYYANEPTNAWVGYSTTSHVTLTPMTGYTRKYVYGESDGNMVVPFIGTLNTAAQSVALTGTTINTVYNGWNLVGNPYPSALDWDAASGWTKTNIEGSYYVRSNGNYGSYNAGLGTVSTTRYIPPMQAFWVRVASPNTSGTLSCNNNVRVHNTQNIYKATFDNTLHLTITNDTTSLPDDIYVRFNPDATDSFDLQYDAYKMYAADTTYPQLYTNNGVDVSINNLSDLTASRVVPLGFKTTVAGSFTLTADMVSSFTDLGNTVYLEDVNTCLSGFVSSQYL